MFRSRAEETVWTAVRAKLRDSDLLVHGQRFTGRDGDWEVDLILLMPEGFTTIEVKGGHVWRADGCWWQRTPHGAKAIDLEEQAVSGKYLLRRWLEPRWSFGKPRMAHLVALPDVDLGPDDPSPGLPRAWIADRGQTKDIAGLAFDLLAGRLDQEPLHGPGAAAVDVAADLLGGRGDPQRELDGMVRVLEDHVEHLTAEQASVLDLATSLPRFAVVGGAGTGKTWLAVEQARRWAEEGLRVAFVCYSRGLSTWVRRRVDTWPTKQSQRAWVGTYHALGVTWGVDVVDGADQHWWDVTMPASMLLRANDLDDANRFDALVVDEAQDFADGWWPPLLAALQDDARIAVFGDDGQRIFGRTGRPAMELPTLTLHENLRNTTQIGHAFAPLAPAPPRLRGGEGPAVRWVRCAAEDAVEKADEEAVRLLDEGWQPQQVALLTTYHRHPMQIERVAAVGAQGYWDELWTGTDLFYATVLGFKGLERPAVVLAVDGFRDPALARDLLYVGMSRARDLLVVCGDVTATMPA